MFKKPVFSDNVKAGALRWWLMGMCYFMIGFGTEAGLANDPLDLIALLIICTALVTIYIYNPIAYNAFKIVRNGKILNTQYHTQKGWKKALRNIGELAISGVVVVLVYLSYQSINGVIIQLCQLPEESVVVPGEPIGFATFYVIFHSILMWLIYRIKELREENAVEAKKESESV